MVRLSGTICSGTNPPGRVDRSNCPNTSASMETRFPSASSWSAVSFVSPVSRDESWLFRQSRLSRLFCPLSDSAVSLFSRQLSFSSTDAFGSTSSVKPQPLQLSSRRADNPETSSVSSGSPSQFSVSSQSSFSSPFKSATPLSAGIVSAVICSSSSRENQPFPSVSMPLSRLRSAASGKFSSLSSR